MSAISTVVVGMSGKVDSFVAAYLLKKQGFNVIGVSIRMVDLDDPSYARRRLPSIQEILSSEEEKVNDLSYLPAFFSDCHLVNLEKARVQAEHLEIPFYAVNAFSEFKSLILDRVLSAGILGEKLYPCMHCHQLMIDILVQKADKLKAQMVATGHYARIQAIKNQKIFAIASSHDLAMDQSMKLAQLTQHQLSRLLLPLAEMRRGEVLKIAKTLSTDVQVSNEDQLCFTSSPYLPEFIERTTPISLRKSGQMLRYEDDLLLGDHKGLYHFMLGEKRPEEKDHHGPKNEEDELIAVQKNTKTGAVFFANQKNFKFKSFILHQLVLNPLLNTTKPCLAIARVAVSKESWPCVLHFKNNQFILVELQNEIQGFIAPGASVGIYEDEHPGSRLLASGVVANIPMLNSVFFKRENDKDVARTTLLLERNKKFGF